MAADPETVWIGAGPHISAWHVNPDCPKGGSLPSFREFVEAAGFGPCGKCVTDTVYECDCGEAFDTHTAYGAHSRWCDISPDETGGGKGASEPTAEDLQAAVDKLGPQPYLYDVADECEIDPDRCRTLLHEIGLYGDVIDAASRTKRAGVPRRD